jgi:hypothetical protein
MLELLLVIPTQYLCNFLHSTTRPGLPVPTCPQDVMKLINPNDIRKTQKFLIGSYLFLACIKRI